MSKLCNIISIFIANKYGNMTSLTKVLYALPRTLSHIQLKMAIVYMHKYVHSSLGEWKFEMIMLRNSPPLSLLAPFS